MLDSANKSFNAMFWFPFSVMFWYLRLETKVQEYVQLEEQLNVAEHKAREADRTAQLQTSKAQEIVTK